MTERDNINDVRTVLVVDNEVLVRMPIAAYLRQCGYRVVEAANADEALTVLGERQIRVDFVLVDAKMRGPFDGFALSQWVRMNRPEIRTILSGTPQRAAAIAGDLCEEGPTLAKPYDPKSVEGYIRRLLATKPAAKS